MRRRGERAARPRLPGAGLGGAFFFFSQFPLAGSRKPGAAGRSGPRCSSSRSRPGPAAAAAAEAAAGGAEPPRPPLLRKKPAQTPPRPYPCAHIPVPRFPRPGPGAPTPASASANFHAASAARPGSTPMGEWGAPGCPPQPGGGAPVPGPRSRGGRPGSRAPAGDTAVGTLPASRTPHSLPLASASLPSPSGADGNPAGAWAEDRGGRPGAAGAEGCGGCGWLFGWAGRVLAIFSPPARLSLRWGRRYQELVGSGPAQGLMCPPGLAAGEAGIAGSRGGRGPGAFAGG